MGAASLGQCWQSHQKWYFHSAQCFFASFCLVVGLWGLLIMEAQAEGTTSACACLSCVVSFTVILRPFQWQCFGDVDVITDLFLETGVGASLGGLSRHGTDFPAGAPQVHDFDLGVKLQQYGGGSRCWMAWDSRPPKKVVPSPPLSQKQDKF